MSIKGKVVSGVKWTTISTIVLTITAILKLSVLARFLDKADFGLMAMITFVMGFVNLFNDMGLTSAILHKQDINKEEYASLYWFNLLVSFFMYFVLWLITPFIAAFYEQPELNVLIPLLGLNLIISGIGRQFKTIENKLLNFKLVSLIEITASIFSLILAVFLAMNNFGVLSLIYPALIQFFISNVLFLILGLKKYGLLFHLKFENVKPFFKIGSYYVGGQVINYFNRDLDILLIGKFYSAEILGGYSLARELVRRPAALITPLVSKVGAPTLAGFNNDKLKLKEYYLKLVNVVASVTIPLYIFIAIFASLIIRVLYGEGFESVTILVQILSMNMVFRLIGGVVGNLVVATGRTDLDFKWNLISLFVTPAFVIVGAQFSIEWVAIMITLNSIVLFVPSWHFYIRRLIDVSLLEYAQAFFIIKRIKSKSPFF